MPRSRLTVDLADNATMLEESGCIEVIGTASSVDDAERFLAGRRPDCVFLDIDMPGRLGPDLVASLPAETRHVFVTAHEQHAAAAFHQGAVDYIVKPFDADRLVIRLAALRSRVWQSRDQTLLVFTGVGSGERG